MLDATTPNDWLIVPGYRAGPITRTTTHADLIRIFGPKNILDEEQDIGEGNFQRVTVLNKAYPAQSATVLWKDGDLTKRVEVIQFCTYAKTECRWHTREQITFGRTLKTLERLNGRSFTLAGFGWDYGGNVISFGGGSLSTLMPECGSLVLRLDPPAPKASDNSLMRQLEDQVTGDREFSSAHPGMQALNPKITEMEMEFVNCANRWCASTAHHPVH